MTDKINGLEAIARVAAFVHEHPDIKPKDHRKVMAEMLEPMIEELFVAHQFDEREDKL